MYFHKIHDPINFSFPKSYDAARRRLVVGKHTLGVDLADLGDDVFRIRINSELWPHQYSQVELQAPEPRARSAAQLSMTARGDFELLDADGASLLRSVARQSFGVSGRAWLFHFELPTPTQFYGMGEKGVGFERSGLRTKFWNTDMQVGERKSNQNDLSQIELHCFCPPGTSAELEYTFDDGQSPAYAKGAESRILFQAQARGSQLRLRATPLATGFGPLRVRVVLHAPLETLVFDDGASRRVVPLRGAKVRLTGAPLSVAVSRAFTVG